MKTRDEQLQEASEGISQILREHRADLESIAAGTGRTVEEVVSEIVQTACEIHNKLAESGTHWK